mgnify:FL=1
MIIGVVGPIAAGKDEVAAILQEQGFTRLSLADELRAELTEREIELTRTNLQDMGDELRGTHGVDFLAQRVIRQIHSGNNYVITGFRNPAELQALRSLPDFTILAVDATLDDRFKRLLLRGRERDPKTIDEFKIVSDRDLGIGQPLHGQQNGACIELADTRIVNEGTLDDLRKKVDEMGGNLSTLRG